ncbi:MAG TPA: hypothetical protein VF756_00835 [Thermoanaerobaculia bacterium]
MRLPNADRVIIDNRKLRDYLLSPAHPVGRFKAAFFASLGFDAAAWDQLELQLRTLALHNRAELDERTTFGQKYIVRGIIKGSTTRYAEVRTVWIIRQGEDIPRFVTALPGE